MKRISFVCLALLVAACFSEDGVDLGKPASFIRFFNDGYTNEAIALEVTTDDGFIILMNSTIQDSEAETPRDKICLIKADQYGNELWRQYYPDIAERDIRWKAHSLTLLDDGGYLVMGESINDQKSDMLAFMVDEAGENIVQKVLTYAATGPNPSPNNHFSFTTIGQAAVATKSTDPINGNFLFLASSENPTGKMVIGELDRTTLDTVWTISRGEDFVSSLTNRLFYNIGGDGLIYWGGTVIKATGEKSDIRFTKNPVNSIPAGDPNIGQPIYAEAAYDMCLSGNVFCFVGTIDRSPAVNNTDIFFVRGTTDSKTYIKQFIKADTATVNFDNDKNEIGNSISPTKDGGFIILATIDTYTGIIGRGDTDILLLKVNGFGDYQWSVPYGVIGADFGKTVRQTSDGGYVALATSTLAGTRTLMLLKTDKDGDVD